MAKQVGPLFFTGTIDGVIFYKVGEQYLVRSKGSYKSAKHMRRNPRYKRTMQNADQFGEASSSTKEVYYQYVPKEVRRRGLYGKLTGRVKQWLQQGKSKAEAKELLITYCQTLAATQPKTTAPKPPVASINEQLKSVNGRQQPTITPRPKQARYLSRWKVKRNGRLHIPRRTTELTSQLE